MRLTLLVLTIDGKEELPRSLPELAGIADELVIGVDDSTTDASEEIGRRFTDRVYPVAHAGFGGCGRPEDLNPIECMLPYCRGDWVLRIDHDETLSPLWHDRNYVAELLADRYATHYWLPRRWAVPPGDRYIWNRHWFPDYQLRMFRNIPSLINFNRTPHAPLSLRGEPRHLADSWLIHWDYVWHDRQTREAKVEFYRELRSYTAKEFYLYEEQSYDTRPLNYTIDAAPPALNSSGNGGPFDALLEIVECPARMPAGEIAPVTIRITNRSDRMFWPHSVGVYAANVMAAYHWYPTGGAPQPEWFEGKRHPMPKRVSPGESVLLFLGVEAPARPGDYFFEPDLVEEGVAWFSSHNAVPSCPVHVTAAYE